SSNDDKDPNFVEIPENAEPLEENNSSGERTMDFSGDDADVVESPQAMAPAEHESDIEAKRRRIEQWVADLQAATEAHNVYGSNSFDGAMFSPNADSYKSPTASELISNQRKLFEDQLEAMYTNGILERDETKHVAGQGYFRTIAATLGTCSDLLNSIVIAFQTNSVPREATLQRTLEELSNYLLEGDVICLRGLCQASKTLLGEGNMIGRVAVSDMYRCLTFV
ncbi:hypothetical protein A2U01_0003542, partial [Trifolium medium]|nr:hypothetical protein [Trifolium medium]